MKITRKYQIGDMLETYSGFIVEVKEIVTVAILRVSYGLDRNGKDMLGLINVDIHLKYNS